MKQLFFLYILFVCFLAHGQSEYVKSFHSNVTILANSDIKISETIVIQSNRQIFIQGLARELPLTRMDSSGRKITLDYALEDILHNGQPSNYFPRIKGKSLVIYIGMKGVLLKPEEHIYTINYTVKGQIEFFKEYDQINWNVNGFGWKIPIQKVSANVYLPKGAKVLNNSCHTSTYESATSNCFNNVNNNAVYFESENIEAGENMAIAINFPKGFASKPTLPPPSNSFEKYSILILGIIFFIALMVYYTFTWIKYGVDPKPTVHPQYTSPNNLSPASIGMLHKERYWNGLISVSIINLGIKGFIDIKEVPITFLGIFKSKAFILIKKKRYASYLAPEEKIIMKVLFKESSKFILNGAQNTSVSKMMEDCKNSLKKNHDKLINKGNNYKFLRFPALFIIAFVFAAFIVKISNISVSTNDIFSLLFEGIITFLAIALVSFSVSKFLSFFEIKVKTLKLIIGGIIALIIGFIVHNQNTNGWHNYSLNSYALVGFFFIFIISLFVYSYLIKRPNEKKLKLRSLINGLKMYISAEEKQIQHFNPPAMTCEVFEKMLPYAIVLDRDIVWSKKFQKTINSPTTAAYNPTWYSGPSTTYSVKFWSTLNNSLSNILSKSKPYQIFYHRSRSPFGSIYAGAKYTGGGAGGGLGSGGGGW